MVCGHAHPQNTLPKTTVNRMINTMKVSMPRAKMKKSCRAKNLPEQNEFSAQHIEKKYWFAFNFQERQVKKMARYTRLAMVRILYNRPVGCLGWIYLLWPVLSMVATESRKLWSREISLFFSLPDYVQIRKCANVQM